MEARDLLDIEFKAMVRRMMNITKKGIETIKRTSQK